MINGKSMLRSNSILLCGIALSGCFDASKPSHPVSLEFDGNWRGQRIDLSGNPICSPTAITGTVSQGRVELTLAYNSTLLTGWISEYGQLVLHDNNGMWDYQFSGVAKGDKISGKWSLANASCKGDWYVERRT